MDTVTAAMIGFIRSIGLEVELKEVTESTFVPGITIQQGRLVVDLERMHYPGDMLHEAGHLAVAVPERRRTLHLDIGQNGTEEMMAIAWSYAAALRIGIDPAIVFHAEGYRGGSASLLDNFSEGRYLALPMLEWTGMAYGPKRAEEEGVAPYPHMLRWLRPAPPPQELSEADDATQGGASREVSFGSASSIHATTGEVRKQEGLAPTDIVKLGFTFDPLALQADLARIHPEEWTPHFNNQIFEGDWSGVALRSVGGTSGTIYSGLDTRSDCQDTPLLGRCPYLQQVLESFRCPLQSARLLKLEPRSHIHKHSDPYLGYADGEVRLHIPVQTDPEVRFYLEGERVLMQPGECWYLNLSRSHWVDNFSDIPRIHLVIDCEVNDWLAAHFPPGMPAIQREPQI